MMSVGSINERGYLQGFDRRGYTPAKCLLELVANSLDSIDRKGSQEGLIRFYIGISEIRMSDRYSEGMDRAAITSMFDLHRENNASSQTRGVSGIGAKPALSILSQKRDMHIFTHKDNGEHLRVDIPWSTIHSQGQYTGMVRVRPMTGSEVEEFGQESGTILVFPYSDALKDLIYDNFHVQEGAPLDRMSIVFGRDPVRIEYKHHEEHESRLLPMYNYFPAYSTDYYLGVTTATIEHWYSESEGKDRFICENKEVQRLGRGWAKDPSEVTKNLQGYTRVGDYIVLAGLRRDTNVFDLTNPVLPTGDTSRCNAYNVEHLGHDNTEFLCKTKLVRNGQTIGLIPLADKNIASARAGGDMYCKIQLVQCEVRYYPVSTQDNRQDIAMGIQENKNQFDGESLPLNFTRLVTKIRWDKGAAIWNYFVRTKAEEDEKAAEAARALVQPQAESESESESEAEPEVEAEPDVESEPEAPISILNYFQKPVSTNGCDIVSRLEALLKAVHASSHYSTDVLTHLEGLESSIGKIQV
jgi:hypothetical protein